MGEQSKKQAFAKALGVAADFYGQSLDVGQLQTWWALMGDREVAEIEAAIKRHMMQPDSGRFMPKPADLLAFMDGDPAQRAGAAWAMILDAVSYHGTNRAIALDDPHAAAGLEAIGGWVALGMSQQDELPFIRARFEKAYQAHVKHPTPVKTLFIGRMERENPVLLGDPAKAQALLESQGSAIGGPALALVQNVARAS